MDVCSLEYYLGNINQTALSLLRSCELKVAHTSWQKLDQLQDLKPMCNVSVLFLLRCIRVSKEI